MKAGPAGDNSEVYGTSLTNVKAFKELNQLLPVPLNFGQNIDVDQLVENQAKWHKSCHLKFKLQRAREMEVPAVVTPQIRDAVCSASLWTRAIVYSAENRMDLSKSSRPLMRVRM